MTQIHNIEATASVIEIVEAGGVYTRRKVFDVTREVVVQLQQIRGRPVSGIYVFSTATRLLNILEPRTIDDADSN